jgi:uncharacterized membrane protein
MGLTIEILGLVLFIGAHLFVTMRGNREKLIARIGRTSYYSVFAFVATLGIVLIGVGFARYRAEGLVPLWHPPHWTRHIVVTLMWPASIAVVAAYIPGDIKRVLKHPMLVGVKLWALAHLCANGDLGGVILFGSIILWAGYDRFTLKRRADPGAPPIPIGGRRNDIFAIIVGTIVYLALGLAFHPLVVGLPAFGTPAYGF